MTVKISQDTNYINSIRDAATRIITASNIAQAEWNSCFGGAGRLPDTAFTDNNAGLVKADIENTINAITQLNAWLDEPGYDRRANLMAVAQI